MKFNRNSPSIGTTVAIACLSKSAATGGLAICGELYLAWHRERFELKIDASLTGRSGTGGSAPWVRCADLIMPTKLGRCAGAKGANTAALEPA